MHDDVGSTARASTAAARRPRRRLVVALVVAIVATAAFAAPPPNAVALDEEPALPIVFVHGFSGSAAQYETQALRWASNDYPNVVTAIDRTSASPSVIYPILDDFFDDVMEQTGAPQVYALGHSQGTAVMNGYLNSSPERAARVAKYIGIDGATAASCPGGVPCMGIWARGNPARALGSENVYFPEQGHTDVVTSPESFAAQYRFFTGHDPATTLVLPERPGQVSISGRALNFPANTGIDGAIVQVWEVNASTGQRAAPTPISEETVGPDGNFGPVRVNGQRHHEISVIRQSDDGPLTQHFYFEPWIRSNHLIRLNLAPVGSALSSAIQRGPHTVVSIVRQREWWGENPVDPANVDSLRISTTSATLPDQPPVEVLNPATVPYTGSTIAMIAFDVDVDATTDVSELATLAPFISGLDVYMPATEPPDGVITLAHQQRRTSHPQVLHTPNWASEAGHGMTVTFREWVQDITTWGECMRAKPSPCR